MHTLATVAHVSRNGIHTLATVNTSTMAPAPITQGLLNVPKGEKVAEWVSRSYLPTSDKSLGGQKSS